MKLFRSRAPFVPFASPTMLLCCAASLAAPTAAQNPIEPELGTLGITTPQSTDVRLRDTLVHQDTYGGNNQTLLVACGAGGGGFALVWRDQRDGMLGLYLARLNAAGELREPEQPIHQPHSGRRRDPALALNADSSGTVVWMSELEGESVPWMRAFDAAGKFVSPDLTLGRGANPSDAATVRGAGARLPAMAPLEKGGSLLVWTRSGQLLSQLLTAGGEPLGEVRRLRTEGGAEPGPGLASAGEHALCVFKVKDQNYAIDALSPTAKANACGAGALASLRADPTGGYWALFESEGQALLRHLGSDGKPDRTELKALAGPVKNLDLALHAGGLAIVYERGAASAADARGAPDARGARAGAERGGADARAGAASQGLELMLLDRTGVVKDAAVELATPAMRMIGRPLLASDGAQLLIAWTDMRNGDPDVYARVFDPLAEAQARLHDERRINTDVASSDQNNPSLASAGDRGLICWQDKRDERYRIIVRRLSVAGLNGNEIFVPASKDGTKPALGRFACDRPSAAMRANGDFVVLWKELRDEGAVLLAQAFDVDGKPLGTPFAVDEGQFFGGAGVAAAIALPGDRGYVLMWTRPGNAGTWTRRIAPDGQLSGPVRRVSENGDEECNNPALALLDDQRIIAVWDEHAAKEQGATWTIHGRFLEADGTPRGELTRFEASSHNQDWDPCVAPWSGNGFALAWCSGEPSDFSRDVVTRVFNARAGPAGPLMTVCYQANEQDFPQIARLADKTCVVAWEDDVSYYDHTYLRRILPSGKAMGPRVRLNELETKAVEDRVAPYIVPLGDGLAGTFGDRRRSLGWDVFVRILGPKFDDVERH